MHNHDLLHIIPTLNTTLLLAQAQHVGGMQGCHHSFHNRIIQSKCRNIKCFIIPDGMRNRRVFCTGIPQMTRGMASIINEKDFFSDGDE